MNKAGMANIVSALLLSCLLPAKSKYKGVELGVVEKLLNLVAIEEGELVTVDEVAFNARMDGVIQQAGCQANVYCARLSRLGLGAKCFTLTVTGMSG